MTPVIGAGGRPSYSADMRIDSLMEALMRRTIWLVAAAAVLLPACTSTPAPDAGPLTPDEDVFRTISRGANGTGMPPWQYLLNDEERWALVDYVKTFDARFAAAQPRKPMPIPDSPGRSRSVNRGRDVYVKMQCSK